MGANNSTTLGFKYLQQVSSLFYVCKPGAPVPRINNTTTNPITVCYMPGYQKSAVVARAFLPPCASRRRKKRTLSAKTKSSCVQQTYWRTTPPKKCESPEKIPVQVKHWKGTIPGRKRRGRVYVQREAQPKALCSFTEPNKANVFKIKSPEKNKKKYRGTPTSI